MMCCKSGDHEMTTLFPWCDRRISGISQGKYIQRFDSAGGGHLVVCIPIELKHLQPLIDQELQTAGFQVEEPVEKENDSPAPAGQKVLYGQEYNDAMLRGCPKCHAAPGQLCADRGGRFLQRSVFHEERALPSKPNSVFRTSETPSPLSSVICPTCKAKPGEPCWEQDIPGITERRALTLFHTARYEAACRAARHPMPGPITPDKALEKKGLILCITCERRTTCLYELEKEIRNCKHYSLGSTSSICTEYSQEKKTIQVQIHRSLPDDLRADGWSVAVHNDYRQDGVLHTFWLFTKGNRAVKGEGFTDEEALDQVRKDIVILSIPCPKCHSLPGVPCYADADHPPGNIHPERIEAYWKRPIGP